jgi:hypothetical protein
LDELRSLQYCEFLSTRSPRSHMDIPKQREQSAEERIGSMIGKIIVLALIAFFVWGYASTLAAKLGLF